MRSRSAATGLLFVIASACAPRHFSLMRSPAGRDLLLPPGVRGAVSDQAQPDCAPGLPVTPRASHYSLYGCYLQSGFVDLQAGMRLKVVKPITADGGPVRTEVAAQQGLSLAVKSNVTGVETAFLPVRPIAGGGVAVEAAFDATAAPATHFRLFFLARDLDQGRKITLIGARSTAELDRHSAALDTYCAQPKAPCMALTQGTVIAPEIPVTVNGKPEFVALGAMLREVVPPGVDPPRVRLSRLWRGRLVAVRPASAATHTSPSILRLPLNSGDSIVW